MWPRGRVAGAQEWRARGSAVLVQPYAPCLWHTKGLRDEAPWYFARGEGARLWDDDGREFIDLEMGLGPVLLGYDHPIVREALRRHASTPAVTTLLHRSEVEVAELLVEMIPSAELVVFGKNGSDACTAAARVARAATGRSIILSSGFHGIHDWFIVDYYYPSEGLVPAFGGYLKNFAFNDADGLAKLAEAHAGDVAAIMLDPANREVPRDGFLQEVRRIADRHGALLIFDEVLTAFRVHRGGGQALYGVTPDLTCVGKALANGLPLSALVGRSDIMQAVNRIFYALTFQHDSVALAVSRACLQYYRDHDVAGEVARKGEILRGLFDEAAAAAGLSGRAVGLASRLDLDFWPVGPVTTLDQQVVFGRALLERGVLPVRVALPCELLTDADLEKVQHAFAHGCKQVARYLDAGRANIFVVFSNPEAVREVFTGDGELLRSGEANRRGDVVIGPGSLLLLDGERHLRERRLLQPLFHGERMRAYGEVMLAAADRTIDAWPVGRAFPVHPSMQAVTLDVILRTVFGLEDASELEPLRRALGRLLQMLVNPQRLGLQVDLGPLTAWGRLKRLLRSVDGMLLAAIARRRRLGGHGRSDVLSLLIEARDETSEPLPDAALRDELITFLLAGHETTATALAWTFHRLLAHPDVLAQVRAELDRVVGRGPVRVEHLVELVFLDATIKETLRLHPIVPFVVRRLAEPMSIGGCDLPAGVVAAPSIYLTQRRADVWPDPLHFDPGRFLGRTPSPYVYFPFGGGVRRCIGMAFALYEMRAVVAATLARVEMRAPTGSAVRLVRRGLTFAPSRGMPVVADGRRGSVWSRALGGGEDASN